MKVTIQLLGQARQLAKSDRVTMEVPEGASVDDLVPGLLGEASERLLTVLVEDQRLRRSVMAILRDETIDPAAPNLLQDGDELSLLPPMSGG
ncbi:MAG: MoaD/ThiS family protein [Roseibacillus sp.]|jgi:molybdopterin converting factor small subunit|nr:MoaD/ThiS family protein [Roseibacillus sp.]MDP7107044.1 MoaD/ThiS family protein [Roseibacillus sp.]MDP7307502.1 MoaD/ThiS family protein [Roseibacillus sp.]MDP7496422.1 MoaD/ThiS family protein [Roseibacillus sp.]MDP7656831.1 MoaD/ThiS family protein [Roseibacillus sp.]|tara:strand:+ start:5608 stop:5883 length:276 start_codon:yes stop_codon:yes gene_type:complete